MMGTLIKTIRQEIQKALPQTSINSSNSRSTTTDGRFVRLNTQGTKRQSAKTKTKIKGIQTITKDTITIETIDTATVAIHKTAAITTIAIHQTSNKTETTQANK